MKAPDKIYADPEVFNISDEFNDLLQTKEEGCVEYTRTDAFIEKACKWLNKNADKYIWYSDYAEFPGNDTCGMNDDFIKDFKDYMKGE